MATEETQVTDSEAAELSNDVEGGAPEGQDAAPEQGGQQAPGEPKRVRASHWTALQKELGSVKESFTKQQQTWQQELARRDAELAELRGWQRAQMERAQEKAQEPAGPSAEDLFEEAQKALDANDMRSYHRKLAEANVALTMERVKTMLPKQAPAAAPQPQMDPVIQGMYVQYAQKVQDPQRLMKLAIIKDQELDALGIPQSYERYRSAFEGAATALGANKPETPKYSAGLAGTLSAPPSRPAASNGKQTEERPPLTPEERAVAEWMGGEKEFMKYR